MKVLLAMIALSTAVACGKKVEAVPVVAEPAKVEAVKEEVKPVSVVSGVQSPVVVETVDAGVPAPVVPAPPASPVK